MLICQPQFGMAAITPFNSKTKTHDKAMEKLDQKLEATEEAIKKAETELEVLNI